MIDSGTAMILKIQVSSCIELWSPGRWLRYYSCDLLYKRGLYRKNSRGVLYRNRMTYAKASDLSLQLKISDKETLKENHEKTIIWGNSVRRP